MTFQIVINLIIAIGWMFFTESYTLPGFIMGYILGILSLLLLSRFISDTFYLKRLFKVATLIGMFFRALITSNIDMIKLIYMKKPEFEPGIFALPTTLKSDLEIVMLVHLISLTPRTLSVAVARDHSHLYIHAMDIDSIGETIDTIKSSFEQAIMEVTR
ncbi:Na+/H+ antiporter subunit E [Lentibacillus sp. CBA3610]|uniref:Na+/H+ antiporter subunit E n=1 Tax=Lentibacillus sp. CBA3610 TaxID=2518176 RepID=UPI001594E7DC|nr:Na+/H+ antiporter subunit E [Lentibacillus sp. CBA3610]QKY69528.1 Na+/H+ antiporter subunit E [Lentibacillus sp. CBA3610]